MSKEPKYLICTCNQCGQRLEFPAEGVGQEIQCPTCGQTIWLYRPASVPVPPLIPPSASPVRPAGPPTAQAHASKLSKPTVAIISTVVSMAICWLFFLLLPGSSQKHGSSPSEPAHRRIVGAFGWELGKACPTNAVESLLNSGFCAIMETTNYSPFGYVGFYALNDRRIYLIWGEGGMTEKQREELLSVLEDKYGAVIHNFYDPELFVEEGSLAPRFMGDRIMEGERSITLSYNLGVGTLFYKDDSLFQLHKEEVKTAEQAFEREEQAGERAEKAGFATNF